ncbi:MAG: hypothetical protein M0013_08985 [Actinomycetota bacterium]|jgi:hypothetical protein|nr:hypothetical protein [Actinomycetota bacterium]
MLRLMRRRRDLRAQVKRVLAQMGDEPMGIASFLCSSGVRGVPNDPRQCILARYLSAVVGTHRAVAQVIVSKTDLALLRPRRLAVPIRVVLPPAMRSFIRIFDAYELPHLVAQVPVQPPTGHRAGGVA